MKIIVKFNLLLLLVVLSSTLFAQNSSSCINMGIVSIKEEPTLHIRVAYSVPNIKTTETIVFSYGYHQYSGSWSFPVNPGETHYANLDIPSGLISHEIMLNCTIAGDLVHCLEGCYVTIDGFACAEPDCP